MGKETVQNLIALRFANPLLENQWNNQHIDYVEISVAEDVGIEGRWGYFDQAGQMRDMVYYCAVDDRNGSIFRAA